METKQAGPAMAQPEEDNGGLQHHYTWCCENSDPQMRPKGRRLTSTCGFISVYSSKHDLIALHQQGKKPSRSGWPNATCRRCQSNGINRKGRLNPGKRDMKHFTDKNEARAYAYAQNQRSGVQ